MGNQEFKVASQNDSESSVDDSELGGGLTEREPDWRKESVRRTRSCEVEVPATWAHGCWALITGGTHAQRGVKDQHVLRHRMLHYPDFVRHARFQKRHGKFASEGLQTQLAQSGVQ
ncbi:hypothetical protein GCM10009715_33220 [Paeniglutamicibacter psychrophenolicus]